MNNTLEGYSMTEKMAKKKPQLFVRSDLITDGVAYHCGGPDIDDMAKGLGNIVKAALGELDLNYPILMDVELEIYHMTDQEVAELPDM